jgi:hypothetical protein
LAAAGLDVGSQTFSNPLSQLFRIAEILGTACAFFVAKQFEQPDKLGGNAV